jgi:hypothetical protein
MVMVGVKNKLAWAIRLEIKKTGVERGYSREAYNSQNLGPRGGNCASKRHFAARKAGIR